MNFFMIYMKECTFAADQNIFWTATLFLFKWLYFRIMCEAAKDQNLKLTVFISKKYKIFEIILQTKRLKIPRWTIERISKEIPNRHIQLAKNGQTPL